MPTLPKSKPLKWLKKREQKAKGSRRFDQGNDQLDIYQTKQWKGTRNHHIRSHPICKQCKEEDGRIVAGEVVDHIIPVRQGGKPFEFDNLQTLCYDHHNIKSRIEKDSITYTGDTMYR
jgi:hypothetical protein